MSYEVTPSRDKKYQDAYLLIQSLAGVGTFSAAEKLDITRFINRRFRTAYNSSSAWPRYLVPNQKRAVSSFAVSGITAGTNVGAGTVSVLNGLYYLIGYLDPNLFGTNADGSNKPVYGRTSNYVFGQNDLVGKMVSYDEYIFTKNGVISDDRWRLSKSTLTVSRYDDKGNAFLSASTTFSSIFVQATNTPEVDNPGDTVFVNGTDMGTGGLSIGGVCIAEKKQCVDFYGDNWSTFGVEKSETRSTLLRDNTNNTGITGYDIGQFIKIHRTKPYVNDSTHEYDFYVDNLGANILNAHGVGNFVFVTYKRPMVDLKTPNTVTAAPVNESFERIPIEFFPYICHGAYSDFLTMDGQVSKAITENELAQNLLDRELEQIDIMYNNNRPVGKFSTYVNRQSR
tara:strand:- start:23649 stop:24839 length:1191 start_codon:yes stop_codon:yes gene_type:complete